MDPDTRLLLSICVVAGALVSGLLSVVAWAGNARQVRRMRAYRRAARRAELSCWKAVKRCADAADELRLATPTKLPYQQP